MRNLATICVVLLATIAHCCNPCYKPHLNENCGEDSNKMDYYTLHMSVHPHLDAYWIFDFESYYDPKPNQYSVHGYFANNRFTSVKKIFNTITNVLTDSKNFRDKHGDNSQRAHRSFFNSEMGFLKRWYFEQDSSTKAKVKQLLNTKYWEILGGGFVEHDEGCAYYDDIIESYQIGLRFLKEQFQYHPKVAISADSFGHSQTTLAILAHLGIEGYFVERSDQHILLENKTQFIWKAKSANGHYYGALPTHIRWAIHGFEDQFIGGDPNEKVCLTKQMYINNMRRENEFLKRILKSNHIMRYFGHDFQEFNEYSYSVIEGIMEQLSREKCNRVIAAYGNPTQYFQTLMGEVWGNKIKPIATRTEDIFPIWDYDSGLYWTGYFTTDPLHKKHFRDSGRMLHALRKAFLPSYIDSKKSQQDQENYRKLEELAQQVSYAQHHDGVSGTSKYQVMDTIEERLDKHINAVKDSILNEMFQLSFPINTNNPIFNCSLDTLCQIPSGLSSDVYLKVFNSGGDRKGQPFKLKLPYNEYYKPNCEYEINCMCQSLPCDCTLYLYARLFTYTPIKLTKVQLSQVQVNKLEILTNSAQYIHNSTHLSIVHKGKHYSIGYKRVKAEGTPRNYNHLSRYGEQISRGFTIRPGKYALGNNPNIISDVSEIKTVLKLQSNRLTIIVVKWRRDQMKTIITIRKDMPNEWKVETYSAARGVLEDIYFEVGTTINNQGKFYTDSNGWLVLPRTLFKHQDYSAFFSQQKYDDIDGNSYPMTAFSYIEDDNDKVSVNTDRAQGVISYQNGKIWICFDRLSQDDGKWVYENTYRYQYQRFTHIITVNNRNYNERKLQMLYDQPIFMQGNAIHPNERVEDANYDFQLRDKWQDISGLDNVKLLIKPWNDSTVTVRVHNLHDTEVRKVGLFANKTSPILTTFFGNQVRFKKLEESALGGNMNYQTFLSEKWNWNKVVDLNNQNDIFNKVLQENIILRPLQIRTFTFEGLSIVMDCDQPEKLQYTKTSISYTIDTTKPHPMRDKNSREQIAAQYLLHGDHCNEQSPILSIIPTKNKQKTEKPKPQKTQTIQQKKIQPRQQNKPQPKKQPNPIPKIVQVTKEKEKIPIEQKKQKTNQQKVSQQFQKIKNKIQNLLMIPKSQKQTKRLDQIRKEKSV